MNKPSNYISENAAIETVKRLFANSPDSDSVTLEEVYSATDRSDFNEQANKNWLSNKMTQIKYHDLIKSLYKYDGRKKLVGIQLTIKGKRALGRISNDIIDDDQQVGDTNYKSVTASDVAKVVKVFRDNNPEYTVVFEVKLKEVQ
jgi:hypothetical protein